MSNEERFVIQGPDKSGFAGPWSIWDSMMSTWNGVQYTDDPVVTGLQSEDDAKQAVRSLNHLVGFKLDIGDRSCNRLDYLIAHAPPIQIYKFDEEYRDAPTPEEQARRAVRFAQEVMKETAKK